MKMSKESYEKFTNIYNYIVENATDYEVAYIIKCIYDAAKIAAGSKNKNAKN